MNMPQFRHKESVFDDVELLADPRGHFHPCSSGDEGTGSEGLSREAGLLGQAIHESAPVGSESLVVSRSPLRNTSHPQCGV